MLGQKLCHQVKSYKNLIYALEATFSDQYSWKLLSGHKVYLMISRISLERDNVKLNLGH